MVSSRMPNSGKIDFQSLILYVLFLILSGIYFISWYLHVDPFPDRDSVHQIFFPFLNSLKTGSEISCNPLFSKGVLNEAYPWGLALISSVISFVGLDFFFLQYPWALMALMLIPICTIPFLLTNQRPLQILIFAGVCLFPTTHIALKSFSFHGMITLLCITAYAGFPHSLKISERKSLFLVLVLLFLAATLKHLGLFFLVCLLYAYFLWKFIRKESLKRDLIGAFCGLVFILFFYPVNGIRVYVQVAFSHSPSLNAGLFAVGAVVAGLLLFANAVKLGRKPMKLPLPLIFRSGWLLAALTALAVLTIAWEPPHDYSIHLVSLCLFLGYGGLFFLLKRYHFEEKRGLVYLTIIVSMIHGTILYYSFIGQVSALFFLPITLGYLQFLVEQPSWPKKLISLFFIFCVSNFSPGVQVLEDYLDDYGHHLYSRGLNGMHQNPLSWENNGFDETRRQITDVLSKISFAKETQILPMLFADLHPHTQIQFLYPSSLTTNLPVFQHLKHMDKFFVSEVREQVATKELKVLEEEDFTVRFPVVIRGLKKWSSFKFQTYSCEETMASLEFYDSNQPEAQKKLELFQDVFGMRLNDCLIQYWDDHGIFARDFRKILIPEADPGVELWLHEGLIEKETNYRFDLERIEELKEQYLFYTDLTLLEKIIFQGAPKTTRAAKLFKRANDSMENNQWQDALIDMEQALKLVPDHEEMQLDLKIIKQELEGRTHGAQPLPYTILFKQANDEMEKKNWKEAESLLLEALNLEPGHPEMLLDLNIIRQELERPSQPDSARSTE